MGGVLVVLVCTLPAVTWAADAVETAGVEAGFEPEPEFDFDSLEISDEFALLAQEDIVVTASRRAQRIDASPSAITVLTR